MTDDSGVQPTGSDPSLSQPSGADPSQLQPTGQDPSQLQSGALNGGWGSDGVGSPSEGALPTGYDQTGSGAGFPSEGALPIAYVQTSQWGSPDPPGSGTRSETWQEGGTSPPTPSAPLQGPPSDQVPPQPHIDSGGEHQVNSIPSYNRDGSLGGYLIVVDGRVIAQTDSLVGEVDVDAAGSVTMHVPREAHVELTGPLGGPPVVVKNDYVRSLTFEPVHIDPQGPPQPPTGQAPARSDQPPAQQQSPPQVAPPAAQRPPSDQPPSDQQQSSATSATPLQLPPLDQRAPQPQLSSQGQQQPIPSGERGVERTVTDILSGAAGLTAAQGEQLFQSHPESFRPPEVNQLIQDMAARLSPGTFARESKTIPDDLVDWGLAWRIIDNHETMSAREFFRRYGMTDAQFQSMRSGLNILWGAQLARDAGRLEDERRAGTIDVDRQHHFEQRIAALMEAIKLGRTAPLAGLTMAQRAMLSGTDPDELLKAAQDGAAGGGIAAAGGAAAWHDTRSGEEFRAMVHDLMSDTRGAVGAVRDLPEPSLKESVWRSASWMRDDTAFRTTPWFQWERFVQQTFGERTNRQLYAAGVEFDTFYKDQLGHRVLVDAKFGLADGFYDLRRFDKSEWTRMMASQADSLSNTIKRQLDAMERSGADRIEWIVPDEAVARSRNDAFRSMGVGGSSELGDRALGVVARHIDPPAHLLK